MTTEDVWLKKARDIVQYIADYQYNPNFHKAYENDLICKISKALREASQARLSNPSARVLAALYPEPSIEHMKAIQSFLEPKSMEISDEQIAEWAEEQRITPDNICDCAVSYTAGFRKAMSLNAIAKMPTDEEAEKFMDNTRGRYCETEEREAFMAGIHWLRSRILGE